MNGIEKLFYRPNEGREEQRNALLCLTKKKQYSEHTEQTVRGGCGGKKMGNLLNSPHFHFDSNLKLHSLTLAPLQAI